METSPYGILFEQYSQFNSLQSSLLDDALYTDLSVVLSAPTGSGKTVAFELAMVRLLQQQQKRETHEHSYKYVPYKAIYVAPIKALCSEKFLDWKVRFDSLDTTCVQITGDTDESDLGAIYGAQLVVTTPEKWDSITRRWREYGDIMRAVRLFMIDEVHLLNEDVRGPILEAIVARMKTIARGCGTNIRFVVASATIPNIEDIAQWIGEAPDHADVVQFKFSDLQRPVPLEKHILGYNSKLKGFQFDMSLNYKLPAVLQKYAEQKPTLIFCNSRKSAEMAAATLERNPSVISLNPQQRLQLTQLSQRVQDPKLCKVVEKGIGFHHAGLTYEDRSLIEESFRNGLLAVLLCTNTLAMGVNFPAHLVIIKSTESYTFGTLQEYPESTLLQMIGRAGRPQYDTKGVAVIMTYNRNVRKYENLMNGKMPVESHLHKHLAEHLNSEISLNTINNFGAAMKWLRGTYLYVRAIRNPQQYGLKVNTTNDKDLIERNLEEMCRVQIRALQAAGMITMNADHAMTMQTTVFGRLMARYYICFETMQLFREIRGSESLLEILNIIVRCKELSQFNLRTNEKKLLNELNESPIRYPIRPRIKTREDKISCLIQAVLGNRTISSAALNQEAMLMLRIADRLAKCLLEYLRLSGNRLTAGDARLSGGNGDGGGCYRASLHAVTIAKCFHAKLWENSEYAAKQLRKIGTVYSSAFVEAGKSSLKSIAMTDARTIERILNKAPPFGDEVLKNLLMTFPEYDLHVALKDLNLLYVHVKQINEMYVRGGGDGDGDVGTGASLIVGNSSNELLLHCENIDNVIMEFGQYEKIIKLSNLEVEDVNVHVIHNTFVGIDERAELVINEEKKQRTMMAVAAAAEAERAAAAEMKMRRKANGGGGGGKRKKQSKLNARKRLNSTLATGDINDTTITTITIPTTSTLSSVTLTSDEIRRAEAIPDDSFLLDLQNYCHENPKPSNANEDKSSTTSSSTATIDLPPTMVKVNRNRNRSLPLTAMKSRAMQNTLTQYFKRMRRGSRTGSLNNTTTSTTKSTTTSTTTSFTMSPKRSTSSFSEFIGNNNESTITIEEVDEKDQSGDPPSFDSSRYEGIDVECDVEIKSNDDSFPIYHFESNRKSPDLFSSTYSIDNSFGNNASIDGKSFLPEASVCDSLPSRLQTFAFKKSKLGASSSDKSYVAPANGNTSTIERDTSPQYLKCIWAKPSKPCPPLPAVIRHNFTIDASNQSNANFQLFNGPPVEKLFGNSKEAIVAAEEPKNSPQHANNEFLAFNNREPKDESFSWSRAGFDLDQCKYLNVSTIFKDKDETKDNLRFGNDWHFQSISSNEEKIVQSSKPCEMPSDEVFRMWYIVTKKFMALPPNKQNFKNFKRIYEILYLKDRTTSIDEFKSRGSSAKKSSNCLPSKPPTKTESQSSAPISQDDNSKANLSHNNPYRLQLLPPRSPQPTKQPKQPPPSSSSAGHPKTQNANNGQTFIGGQELRRSAKNLNQMIMNDILSTKGKEILKTVGDNDGDNNANDTTGNLRKLVNRWDLVSDESDSGSLSMSFDEYYRRHIDE